MQLIEDATKQKLRGAYYTPPAIADFILRWGINDGNNADILEPSCGDGVFLECIANGNMLYKSITAVEFEEEEAEKASEINLHDSQVVNGDFHRFCLDTDLRFDLVVGNPPFIRYQYYDEAQQLLADQIFRNAKLKRTKLTNAWVTFVVGCTQLLRDNAKVGFVIPSELLMVKYAQQLRKYLAKTFNKINIISFENLVFEEIQQEVILLLCEKNGSNEHKIEHIEVKDTEGLLALDPHKLNFPSKDIDFHTDKWTYYFLDKKELDLLEKVQGMNLNSISTFANVEVGITTGANSYFTVPETVVNMYQLSDYAHPMVGRSIQVNSLDFTMKDWTTNVKAGAKAYLLVFTPDAKEDGNESVKAYLTNGENENVHKGYKTSIRENWWVIPSIKISDALFLRRNNLYPKFVLNEAGAYTTDTMHRVFIKEGVNKKALIASYYNSLSFAFAEILGRNFGGGCLELMPSEVGGIYLPYRIENEQIFDKLDQMLRNKATSDEILDFTDEIILRQGVGLTKEEIQLARSIWHKIIKRRLSRETLEKPVEKIEEPKQKYKQLNLFNMYEEFGEESIVDNSKIHEDILKYYNTHTIDVNLSKNCLISLIKKDNFKQYLEQNAKIYYTGRKFPSTVALNKLYYFMPYLKGMGVRDLYMIKIARVGTRKEGQLGEDKNDFRLVFEIEFVKQLFDDYKNIELKIWRTFTDTNINDLISKYDIRNGSDTFE